MRRYRKRPVVIDALQFTRDSQVEMVKFTEGKLYDIKIPRCIDGVMTATVSTLEGTYTVTENDYVIRGVQGEYYPCKPDIFYETYEEVK